MSDPERVDADEPRVALVTVDNVELLEVGTINASSGTHTFTVGDLAAIVAAQDDPGVRSPVIKLGHLDPRFGNDPVNPFVYDGQPALGRVRNLRLSEDRMTLIGDLEGLPRWLAEVMASAYPGRSIEAVGPVETMTGSRHEMVMTGLALLGEALPAVQTLSDVKALYGLTSAEPRYAAESSERTTKREDVLVRASLNVEDVRRSFVAGLVDTWAWVRELWSDFLVVDDDKGQLFKVPWSEGDGGDIVFGEWQPVKVEYVDTDAKQAVAASAGLLTRFTGSDPAPLSGEEPDPQTQETRMDRTALLELLQLTDAADDDEISERIAALLALEAAAADGTPDEGEGEGRETDPSTDPATPAQAPQTKPDDTNDPEAPMHDPAPTSDRVPVAASAPSVKVPDGFVLMDASAQAALLAAAQEGQEARRQQREEHRERVLAAAIGDGRIPAGKLDAYRKRWDADAEGTEELVTKLLEPGLVPVVASGHTTGVDSDTDRFEAEFADLSMFPGLAQNRS